MLFAGRNTGVKRLISSSVAEIVTNRKHEEFKNLKNLEKTKISLDEWNHARPYEKIPGPQPLPIIGNTWRFFLPLVGEFYGLDNLNVQERLHEQYGNIAILKGVHFRQPIVYLFDPKDIEKLFRKEGSWPMRKGFPSLRLFRKLRKNFIASSGLMASDGEKWANFRKIVNPILMKPQNMIQYTDKVNLVADELVDKIKYFSEKNEEGQMPDDFEYELYKWSLESVGVISINNHFGCLKRSTTEDSESQKLINSILQIFELMYKLDVLPSVWKIISTRNWRNYVKNLDYLLHTCLKHVDQRLNQLENGEFDENKEQTQSVLLQLAKVDKEVARAWSFEMILAGVDTTAKVLAAALYYLGKNPEKQEKLRNEALSLLVKKDSPVTEDILKKDMYTKSVIKETTRLATITTGIVRIMTKNIVLGGYQIPPGVHVQTSNLLICRKDEHFPNASDFIPERWLSTTTNELSHKNAHPFVHIPFSFGPRTCAGKRLALLELEIALLKIVRNFELKWPHEDMVFKTYVLHGIAQPLKMHVKQI